MFVHRIDPVMLDLTGVHLWYCGLSYTLGLLSIFLWVRYDRDRFGFSQAAAYMMRESSLRSESW